MRKIKNKIKNALMLALFLVLTSCNPHGEHISSAIPVFVYSDILTGEQSFKETPYYFLNLYSKNGKMIAVMYSADGEVSSKEYPVMVNSDSYSRYYDYYIVDRGERLYFNY